MRHLSLCVIGVVLLAGCSSPSSPSEGTCGGPYPGQEGSLYVLPYEPGQAFLVGAGNCSSAHPRGGVEQYAYDFVMPIGTHVVAARDGEVIFIEERFADSTRTTGQGNGMYVRHADGTVAMYWHLTTNGALVEVGDQVVRGQLIALSGDSGDSTSPHLHFEVMACSDCASMAVTFRNTRPHPSGLVTGQTYRAE